MVAGVVISALEIVEAGFGVVVIAPVAQGIDAGHCAGAGEQITPCVVGVLRNEGSTIPLTLLVTSPACDC